MRGIFTLEFWLIITYINPVVTKKKGEDQSAERMNANIHKIAGELQGWLEKKLGDAPYFAGDEFGYADICIAPIINSSVGSGLGPKDSKLAAWLERVKERTSVRTTFDEARDECSCKAQSQRPDQCNHCRRTH